MKKRFNAENYFVKKFTEERFTKKAAGDFYRHTQTVLSYYWRRGATPPTIPHTYRFADTLARAAKKIGIRDLSKATKQKLDKLFAGRSFPLVPRKSRTPVMPSLGAVPRRKTPRKVTYRYSVTFARKTYSIELGTKLKTGRTAKHTLARQIYEALYDMAYDAKLRTIAAVGMPGGKRIVPGKPQFTAFSKRYRAYFLQTFGKEAKIKPKIKLISST